MDIGRAISFVFKDKDWISKLVITLIVSAIPIVNFAVFGYLIVLAGRVMRGMSDEEVLPEWSNFGSKWIMGLVGSIAGFIYSLPSSAIGGIAALSAPRPQFRGDEMDMAQFSQGFALTSTSIILMCASVILAFFISFWMLSAMLNAARKGYPAAFFEFGEILETLRDNLGSLIVLAILSWLLGIGYSIVGALLIWTCIGPVVMATLVTMTIAHLGGQVGAEIYAGEI